MIATSDDKERTSVNKKPLATTDNRKRVYPVLNEQRSSGVCILIKSTVSPLLLKKRTRNLNSAIKENRVERKTEKRANLESLH